MIKGLYETHIFVENLERSTNFYKDVLGLKECYYSEERKIRFFWIGEPKQQMLGIWEKPKDEIDIRHFAFESDIDFVLNKSVNFLKEHGLTPRNHLNNDVEEPMVFSWMPALSIYFDDPDGHSLEFIARLDGKPRPEVGVVSYEEWLKLEEI